MSEKKKRKAVDQLSPYSNPDLEYVETKNTTSPKPIVQRKRARANVGKKNGAISNPKALKGALSGIKIFPPPDTDDKLSGLNRCFLRAISQIMKKQSDKDLRYIFKQYEVYVKKIEESADKS